MSLGFPSFSAENASPTEKAWLKSKVHLLVMKEAKKDKLLLEYWAKELSDDAKKKAEEMNTTE